MVRPGDSIAGKYRVDSVIGRGGMGFVVAATHLALEQQVAIKFLRAEVCGNPTALARFMREARATTRLESEHVARVLDLGMHEGAPFMVLELLKGRTLAQELANRGPLPTDVACEYVLQACDALGEAHCMGLVHRDLKPANLFLVRRRGGHVQVKVLDFGVSKMIYRSPGEPSLTDMRSMLGTPLYVSPEQLRNARGVDARTDVWALGVILYELITGQPPFSGTSIAKLFVKIAREAPPPLRGAQSGLSAELERVISRCLEKDPEARFTNAAELGLELAGFAALSPERLDRFVSFAGKMVSYDALDEEDAARSHAPRPRSSPSPQATTAGTRVPRSRAASAWRRRLLAAGVGLLGACALGGSFVALRSLLLRPASVVLEVPAVGAAPSAPSAPAGSVELVVGASPDEARLYLDGRLLPDNPYIGALARSGEHVIRAEAHGYATEERRFTADADVSVSIALRRTRR